MDPVSRNRAHQAEWYGRPLGELIGVLLARLGLTQAGLAGILGLSAPMLSQLMSGQRAKISNPAVLGRLLAVQELVDDPDFVAMPPEQVRARLTAIRAEAPTTARNLRLPDPPPGGGDAVGTVQALLRAVASAAEIETAAGRLERDLPELAELLRAYGTGRTDEARAHYRRVMRPD
ncbi:MAG TPA: DNA-binding protein [Actinocatenispora sp.]